MKSLRAWRAEHLLSTRKLAAAAGTSNKTIVQIENGHQLPSFATIAKICRALDVSPRDVAEFGEALDRRGSRPKAPAAAAVAGEHPVRVVCVSESTAVLEITQRLLAIDGFQVTTLIGASGTFDYIAKTRPDVLIVELEPSRPYGWELLERLNSDARSESIPVIVRARDAWLVDPADVRRTYDGGRGRGASAPDLELSQLVAAVESVIGEPSLIN